jgi:hypothetical protein
MKFARKLTMATILSLCAVSASAELVNADWENAGDGLAAVDTISNKKWLDLSLTSGMSIANVEALLNTTYSGYRIANGADVLELMTNAFPGEPLGAESYYGNYSGANGTAWLSAFGYSVNSSSYGAYIHNGSMMYAASGLHSNSRIVHAFNRTNDPALALASDGIFLIEDANAQGAAVSSPIALGALMFGGLAFGVARRKEKA